MGLRMKNFQPINRGRIANGLRGGLVKKRKVVFLRGFIPQFTLWCVLFIYTTSIRIFLQAVTSTSRDQSKGKNFGPT